MCSDDAIKNKCKNISGIFDGIIPQQTLFIAIAIQSVTCVQLRQYNDILQIEAWLSSDKMISWQCSTNLILATYIYF